jgi:hypothetical protein
MRHCLFTVMFLSVTLLPAAGELIDAPLPQRASITGTVTDEQDAAIPGASVSLQGSTPAQHRVTTGDGAGAFDLIDIDPSRRRKREIPPDARTFESVYLQGR